MNNSFLIIVIAMGFIFGIQFIFNYQFSDGSPSTWENWLVFFETILWITAYIMVFIDLRVRGVLWKKESITKAQKRIERDL